MDCLKVAEVADLQGCSLRHMQRLVKNGKFPAIELPTASNNRKEYGIPIEALPENLKSRYYARKRSELGLQPETKTIKTANKKLLKTVKKPLEDFTEKERKQIAFWTDILKEWLRVRDASDHKVETDHLFIAKFKLEHPDIMISEDILYRKYNAYRENDLETLIGKRGGWNKGNTGIPQHILDGFMYFFLDTNRPPLSQVYRLTVTWTQEFYPEDVPLIPSERSFRRQVEKIPEAVIKLMRYGEKALSDSYIPTVDRWYEDLKANDVWVADNHTFDFHTIGDAGQCHRLHLTAFLDAKSGVMVGWNITENPDSNSTLLALRHGILHYGVPKMIYVDNGREFLCHDFGGMGNRARMTREDFDEENEIPPTILQMMGIKMINAKVRNAKAKPIERTFYTVKNHFSKVVATFCGGTILERPETWKWKIKHGIIPEDQQIRDLFKVYVDGDYNVSGYGGKEKCYKGMTRLEVWNMSIQETEFRKTADGDLPLLLARVSRYQKVGKNGVTIEFKNERLRYYCTEPGRETWRYIGKEVYVRYDPANLMEARIFDKDTDRYIDTWKLDMDMQVPYITDNKDEIAAAEKTICAVRKSIKEHAKGIKDNITGDQAIDLLTMTIIRAEQGLKKFHIEQPKKFKPVFSEKEVLANPDLANIQSVEFNFPDLKKLNDNAEKKRKDKGW